MSTAWMSVLAVLTAALAGCVGQAPGTQGSEAGPTATATTASPGGGAAATDRTAAGNVTLHLDGQLGLKEPPPSQAASVPLPTPVNSPFTAQSPQWSGELPRAVNVTAGVPVVLYVSTNTASIAAKNLPVFADLPGFFLGLTLGEHSYKAEVDGPSTMVAGEVHEVRSTLQGTPREFPAGTKVAFTPDVIYSHLQGAAEFRFVMGPEHPARIEL